jgi:hypothetical protein
MTFGLPIHSDTAPRETTVQERTRRPYDFNDYV